VDTSVLTAGYCPEPGSARAQALLQECTPVVSQVVRLELASAVAKKVRMNALPLGEAKNVVRQFQEHVRGGVFEVVPIEGNHFETATAWMASFKTPLRALDALHLAVAHAEGLPVVTADAKLARAAATLGVAVQKL
jgi:predicted nucleic acid-binding protein